MPELDRTMAICDLLLGAAYADEQFTNHEREAVRELLGDLCGGSDLPSEIEARIELFDPKAVDLDKTCAVFAKDSEDDRRKLLHLISAVHEADEELDFAEDDYVRAVAEALDLPEETLTGIAVDFEVEELKQDFDKLRKSPPPVPGSAASVDVDID
jgi:uncharacterized tellurite resistance protein B-like protein